MIFLMLSNLFTNLENLFITQVGRQISTIFIYSIPINLNSKIVQANIFVLSVLLLELHG